MTVKDYLRQVFTIDREIKSLTMEYEQIFSKTFKVSSMQPDKVQSSSTKSVEDTYLELIDYSKNITDASDRLRDLRIKISSQIDKVEDEQCRSLLRFRYTIGLNWDKVADCMGYNERHVHKIHGRALQLFLSANPDYETWH